MTREWWELCLLLIHYRQHTYNYLHLQPTPTTEGSVTWWRLSIVLTPSDRACKTQENHVTRHKQLRSRKQFNSITNSMVQTLHRHHQSVFIQPWPSTTIPVPIPNRNWRPRACTLVETLSKNALFVSDSYYAALLLDQAFASFPWKCSIRGLIIMVISKCYFSGEHIALS